jgi:hypothetical protein
MRRAFTILELLAATALTALLMLAVLHVIGSLGASRVTLASHAGAAAWRSDLLDTLRRDLVNSSQATFQKDQMTLTGHAALDRATLALHHQPVTIVYGLATIHGRTWLVRRQSSRDGSSNQGVWAELLCPDITGFTVKGWATASAVGARFFSKGANPETIAPPPINGSATLVTVDLAKGPAKETVPAVVSISLEGPAGPVMNETVVIR